MYYFFMCYSLFCVFPTTLSWWKDENSMHLMFGILFLERSTIMIQIKCLKISQDVSQSLFFFLSMLRTDFPSQIPELPRSSGARVRYELKFSTLNSHYNSAKSKVISSDPSKFLGHPNENSPFHIFTYLTYFSFCCLEVNGLCSCYTT